MEKNKCELIEVEYHMPPQTVIGKRNITNFMGHDLAIVVMRNLLFIALYCRNPNIGLVTKAKAYEGACQE
jgi:hypothetical protein